MTHGKLYEVALEARREFETASIDRKLLGDLYVAYEPSVKKEIDQFLDTAFQIFPNGCCGLTAVYLRHALQKGEIKAGEYGGEDHTLYLPFGRIGNFVMDITGDQFQGGEPVYVGPIQKPRRVV